MLGLFPLSLVLFPESTIPLHIFEERYKQLINICLEKKTEFGINLVVSSKIFEIGCKAKVTDVLKVYDDGRMDILVTGVEKYKLISFKEGSHHYYIGEYERYLDTEDLFDYGLLGECLSYYNKLTDLIKSVKIEKIDIFNVQTSFPSYFIAQKSGLTNVQKYNLLELRTENKRLKYLKDHLAKVIPVLKETEYVDKIIKNDGYLNL